MTTAIATLGQKLGILPDYLDQAQETRETSEQTYAALLRAMGTDPDAAESALDALQAEETARPLPLWQVIACDSEVTLDGIAEGVEWHLDFEDGAKRRGQGPQLGRLPLGIHRLWVEDVFCWLLTAPETLPQPARGWGVTLPLYGLRTAAQGGVGTYHDLAAAVGSLGAGGADFAGVNPIHAGFPQDPRAFSPYSPSSRRRFSTLHIAAGAETTGDDLIDYDTVVPAQNAALERLWSDMAPDPDFEAWREAEGASLRRFALHQALSEEFGPVWTHWPAAYRDPTHPEVASFAERNGHRIAYHSWLQWLAEGQLADVRRAAAEAGMSLGLYLDLAVGTHPGGAETWANPELFARGVSLGSPPDGFSPDGQTWALAPMQPATLAQQGFRPLAAILRAGLRYANVLRIDHILGFERAYWVPEDGKTPGGYVSMPKAALLAVARIEAARAGAVVIGEDLGNIPEGLRADLDASGVLGCRVAMFEQDWDAGEGAFLPARAYDTGALTSFSTHDLPTWEGWRAGRDIDWREKLGSHGPEAADEQRRLREVERASLERLIGGTSARDLHAFLAATPSRLVAVQIEDILGLEEQANLPGTVYDHPNWRRRLPVAAADLGQVPGLKETAEVMAAEER
ncbi:4-alpha-glucanotransferase [Mesobaculum littorinae]|uniref:4-alpha-glucanotransferase n=1 Tax=Mesobaculum littorinae TaxID=2486419 RepID=A0A438AL94_9RHOB|nr:4-alpha-glucanotransferase [Mesobaculum littorinae]RVV99613.1 4-alpha-glucanotransferase [Mesobaculum littorinae]